MTLDNIKKYYIESLNDLREAKKPLLIAVIIFLAGISIGLAYPSQGEGLFSALKGIARHLSGKGLPVLILSIFFRNSLSAAISIGLGPLLGIVPILGAISNGLLIGVVLSHIKEIDKMNVVLQLIPHGIFELPAIFMAWGLGIWQGIWFFQKNVSHSLEERRHKTYRIFFIIIMPLLLIAATIEGINIYFSKMY